MHASGVSSRSTSLRDRSSVPAPPAWARCAAAAEAVGARPRFMASSTLPVAGLQNHGTERRELVLYPDHAVHDRFGVAQRIGRTPPIDLAHAHIAELPVDDALHAAAGLSHSPSFRIKQAELGQMPWGKPGICSDPIGSNVNFLPAPMSAAPARHI